MSMLYGKNSEAYPGGIKLGANLRCRKEAT